MAPRRIGKAEIMKVYDQAKRLKESAKRTREQAGETIERVVASVEVGSAAFVLGIIQGRWGPLENWPISLDLSLALGLNLAGFMGFGGARWAPHLNNFGNGALASWTSTTGRGIGLTMKAKTMTPGISGAHAGAALSDKDLDEM